MDYEIIGNINDKEFSHFFDNAREIDIRNKPQPQGIVNQTYLKQVQVEPQIRETGTQQQAGNNVDKSTANGINSAVNFGRSTAKKIFGDEYDITGGNAIADTASKAMDVYNMKHNANNLLKHIVKPLTKEQHLKNQLTIYQTMLNLNYDVGIDKDTAKLYFFDDDGNAHELNSTFFGQLKSMGSETLGGLLGGIVGEQGRKKLFQSALKPKNKIAQAVAGAGSILAGATGGVYLGAILDQLETAVRLNEEFDATKAHERALDGAVGNAIVGAVAPPLISAGKVLGKNLFLKPAQAINDGVVRRFSPTHFIANANIKGAEAELATRIGKTLEDGGKQLEKLNKVAQFGGQKSDNIATKFLDMLPNSPVTSQTKLSALALNDVSLANMAGDLLAQNPKKAGIFLNELQKLDDYALNYLKGENSTAQNIVDIVENIQNRSEKAFRKFDTHLATNRADDIIPKAEVQNVFAPVFDAMGKRTGGAKAKKEISEIMDAILNNDSPLEEFIKVRKSLNSHMFHIDSSVTNEVKKFKEYYDNFLRNILGEKDAKQYFNAVDLHHKIQSEFKEIPLIKAILSPKATDKKISKEILSSLDYTDGFNLKELTKWLNPEDMTKFEVKLFNQIADEATKKLETGNKAVAWMEVGEQINNIQPTTAKGQAIKDMLTIYADAMSESAIIAAKASKSDITIRRNNISTSIQGKVKMEAISHAWLTIKRHLPIVGDDASLQYHIVRGLTREMTPTQLVKHLDETIPNNIATATTQQPNNPVQEYLNSRGIGKQSRLSPEDLKLEQDSIWKTTFGDQSVTQIRTRDLNDVINYSVGNRSEGAKHIIRRHIGEGKYGKITEDELLEMGEIVRNGKIARNSIKRNNDGTKSYAYELTNDGIRFRVVVHRGEEGKKIVTMYSDREATKKAVDTETLNGRLQSYSTADNIIPQNTKNVAKTNINQQTAQDPLSIFLKKIGIENAEQRLLNMARREARSAGEAKMSVIEQILKDINKNYATSQRRIKNNITHRIPAFKQLLRQLQEQPQDNQ